MKFRGLIAAAVILLILGGVLYWSQHRKTPETTGSSEQPAILKVDPPSVKTVTVEQKGAQPVTLTKSATGQWQITAPGNFRADDATVYTMLSSLGPLMADRVVENQASNLAQFGLSDPAVEVDITDKDNKTHRLLIGDDTPTGGSVYVALAGDPRVFTASTSIKSSLNKSLSDLRDKRLLPVESSSVSSIDLDRKDGDIEFARVQNGWQIEKPESYRTDTFQVDDLVDQLTGAKWDPSATADEAAKGFDSGTPVATVKLTGSDGTDTLELRKDKGDYYAKSSAVEGVWKVDSGTATALGEALDRGIDEYRNKQLFDFGYADPDKIEYHAGGTQVDLTRAGNDWWSNGKKMDRASVEAVVTALRDLAATKFVESGFSSPQMDVTVTSGGGKKVEKVQIQKTSDGAIAMRGDGPSLYELDPVTIEGLTDAIAGLKPAAKK